MKVAFFEFLATVLQIDNFEHENIENIATVLCLRELAVQMLQKLTGIAVGSCTGTGCAAVVLCSQPRHQK